MNWITKALVATAIVGAFLIDRSFPDWGAPTLITVLVFGCAIGLFRRFWRQAWYWVTITGLLAVLIPLNIFLRTWMAELKYFFILAVGIVKTLTAGRVILLAFDKAGQHPGGSRRPKSDQSM